MHFKKNWQSMAEKEPAIGHVDMFQTSLNESEWSYLQNTVFFIIPYIVSFCKLFSTILQCGCPYPNVHLGPPQQKMWRAQKKPGSKY